MASIWRNDAHYEALGELEQMFAAQDVAHFNPDELVAQRTTLVPGRGILWRCLPVVSIWDELREESGGPCYFTNFWRDQEHNNRVGGSPNSLHMENIAGDGVSTVWTPEEVYEWMEAHPMANLMGLGLYKTFVHMDLRGLVPHVPGAVAHPAPARWDFR